MTTPRPDWEGRFEELFLYRHEGCLDGHLIDFIRQEIELARQEGKDEQAADDKARLLEQWKKGYETGLEEASYAAKILIAKTIRELKR
jgi:hypothetical protein